MSSAKSLKEKKFKTSEEHRVGEGVYAFVPYMGLSLTYDHRSIDGGEGTRFLKTIANEIENLDLEF